MGCSNLTMYVTTLNWLSHIYDPLHQKIDKMEITPDTYLWFIQGKFY